MPPTTTPDKPDDKLYAPPTGGKFDFILSAGQKPKTRLIGALSGLPRSVTVLIGVIIVLFGLLTLSVVFSGRGDETGKRLLDVARQQQEIIRVSDFATELLQDAETRNLNATVLSVFSSDQAQMVTYMRQNKIKTDRKILGLYANKNTDESLTAARQSNQADKAYRDYLKQQIVKYQESMAFAAPKTGPSGQAVIKESFDSSKVLLVNLD